MILSHCTNYFECSILHGMWRPYSVLLFTTYSAALPIRTTALVLVMTKLSPLSVCYALLPNYLLRPILVYAYEGSR